MNILFVNACIREEESRTLTLCSKLLKRLEKQYPMAAIQEVRLSDLKLKPLDRKTLEVRDRMLSMDDKDSSLFEPAHTFADADLIVVGAPYWDLSFPAVLKAYIEQISVNGIAFYYDENGSPVGLCKAKKLWYVMTAGGYVGELNLGYDYMKALCRLFGIKKTECIMAEGLDIWGTDVNKVMQNAIS